MKISIVTICYEASGVLGTAIESVVGQEGVEVEYIVVDGGSADGTVGLVKSYGEKVSQFVSEGDEGLYDALNKGVRLASGDVIGFVHADDLLADKNVLSEVAGMFTKSKADAVFGDLEYVDKDDPHRVIRYWKSRDYKREKLKFGWMPPHPSLYVRREIYEQARLENGEYFDTLLTIAADYDFMMRILGKMDISAAYLPQVLVKMRVGGESNKSLKNIIRKSREDYTAMKRNGIGGLGTLAAKNFRKVPQFFKRRGIEVQN